MFLFISENNCPKLVVTDKLQFTTSSESQFSYGDKVSYGCDDNYRLVGASMVYCTRNGTWSKSTPKCIRKYCTGIDSDLAVSVSGLGCSFIFNFVYKCIDPVYGQMM